MNTRGWIAFCAVATAPLLLAQQPDTRKDEIEAARQQKEQNLKPMDTPRLEAIIERGESNVIYKLLTSTDGFGIGFGQMVPGAGFSVGPGYQKTVLNGNLRLGASVNGSTKQYYTARVFGSWMNLLNGKGLVDFGASHSDFPEMPYYGVGPQSRKTGRSDYRMERTEVDVRPVVRPFKHVLVGANGGFQTINIGPGTSDKYISTDLQYGEATTPGIVRQTNYLLGGGFVEYDWRDYPGDATQGGRYRAEYTRFSDRDASLYSFYRLELDARQYIPLANGKRVIALHGNTQLADAGKGQVIPFYMQSTLGGPDTMRGFRPYRFYDNNSVLLQGEYRWEASATLDLAVFADGGKVFHDWEQWNLHKAQGSFGFGLRFKATNGVAFRIDTGFSHEGFQVWFRTGNPF